MKKTRIIINIALITIVLLQIISPICMAEPLQINPEEFRPDNISDYSDAENFGKTIAGILRTFGVIVAVIAVTVIGIKYMLGSTEQRADYKKTMLPIAFGIFMLFGITILFSVIIEVANKINE